MVGPRIWGLDDEVRGCHLRRKLQSVGCLPGTENQLTLKLYGSWEEKALTREAQGVWCGGAPWPADKTYSKSVSVRPDNGRTIKNMAEARHAVTYYGHFMTDLERLANRHLSMTIKQHVVRSDLAAQAEAKHRLADLDARTSRSSNRSISNAALRRVALEPTFCSCARGIRCLSLLQTGRRILKTIRTKLR